MERMGVFGIRVTSASTQPQRTGSSPTEVYSEMEFGTIRLPSRRTYAPSLPREFSWTSACTYVPSLPGELSWTPSPTLPHAIRAHAPLAALTALVVLSSTIMSFSEVKIGCKLDTKLDAIRSIQHGRCSSLG